MHAALCLYDAAHLTDFEGKHRVIKGLKHGRPRKLPQISVFRERGAIAPGLRGLFKGDLASDNVGENGLSLDAGVTRRGGDGFAGAAGHSSRRPTAEEKKYFLF